MKSTGTAYLLWFFLGLLGVHKFYLDKVGMGILYIFTLGFLGIGLFIDLFTLGAQVDAYNLRYQSQFNFNSNNGNGQNSQETLTDQLIKLHHLKEQGVLTDEEFVAQKSKLLR